MKLRPVASSSGHAGTAPAAMAVEEEEASMSSSAPPSWSRLTHVYLFILQHRLHLLIPMLQVLFARCPGLVVMSAFAMPEPNVPDRTFTDSSGMFIFKVYTKAPV